MDDTLIIAAIGIALTTFTVALYLRRHRGLERAGELLAQHAHDYGLHEPVSLHPVIDAERCICTGNCVKACPENVIGILRGQTVALNPASCVGHGLCERSCPVDAIQLVFGSEKRGVELPRIQGNFETNVPGLFVVGELGGMGLIRNAFEQSRQCIDGICRQRGPHGNGRLDVVIVGCGPAGLAAALHAQHRGLDYIVLEKEDIGGTVRYYPRKKIVLSGTVTVPGYGKLDFREISKEQLISIWQDVIEHTRLRVNTGELVDDVQRHQDGSFTVVTSRGRYEANRVILAIGRRGVPRKLDVPGEASPTVSYALREAEAFTNDRILVVGGGDSAIEAALALAAQPGNQVSISYRSEAFSRLKPRNRASIESALAQGRIQVYWRSIVTRIDAGSVQLESDGASHSLAVDRVFVFIGGTLPIPFLRKCGIEIDVKFGTP
jgi:thioredoxin reductase/NAD-dependent dihydropyrimidine dehydrogenase PreA subunit